MNLPINLSHGYTETHVEDRNFHQIEHGAWSERATYYDAIFASISTQAIDPILEALEPVRDKRHLDVACGTGHLVAQATRWGAISEGVDFAHAMVAAAQENYAEELFQAADAMDLPYADETFDLVTCSFGLNNMANPQRAVAEAFRVLKVGGRLAFTLWFGAEDGNTSQAIIKDAIARYATLDSKLPESWTQLRNPDEQTCAALARQAGFGSPVFKRLPIVQRVKSAQEMIEKFIKLSLRTRLVIERQPDAVRGLIFQQIRSEVEARRTNGFIPLDWPALLTVVQKPKFEGRAKISSQHEPKYTLFDSIEEMLAPETLSDLLAKPVTGVDCQPITQHDGVSGSKLSYVNTNASRLVLKQMSMKHDPIMFSGGDQKCRSVMLWQYGLLDELRPHLEHKIIAGSLDGDGWVLLMEDLTEQIFRDHPPMSSEFVLQFLDRLARLHATFWNDSRLLDPRLGLGGLGCRYNVTSPSFAQNHIGDHWGVMPGWVKEGWQIMKTHIDPDVYIQIENLHENPQPIIDALSGYPYTLLHGDYAFRNLAHADHPVAFDWQMAVHSLMTIDLAWFISNVRESMKEEQAENYYRRCLETYLDSRFDDKTWQVMLGLGKLYIAVCTICFPAYLSKHVDDTDLRNSFEARVRELSQYVREGMRWL